MNRSNVITIVVLGLVLVGSTAQVQGDTKYFCADTDNTWSATSGRNWRTFVDQQDCDDGTRVDAPTASDRAVIVSGKTCNVDVTTAVADSLNVESTATLNIQTAKKLTIDDDAGSDTTIAGTLNLQGASSELVFEDTDQTIDGAGKIVGQDNAAKITVAVNTTLTNETTIEGKLEITGDSPGNGAFLNQGKVHANVAGTLKVSTGSFDDDSTALWKISDNSDAVLNIAVGGTAPSLQGAFDIRDSGTLDVTDSGFQTSGTLDFYRGWITVAAGSTVTFAD